MPVFFRLKRPAPNAALFPGLLCGILTLFAVGIAASAPGRSSGGYVDEYLQWFRKYVESRESNPIHALAMIDSACAVAERSADDSLVMVSRVNRGSFLVRQSRFDAGESDLQMALVYAERRRDSVQIGAVYNSMGIARQIRDDHAGALEYLLRSIEYLKDPTALARGYNNIGQVFDKLRDNDKAAEYLQKAVELHRAAGNTALASGSMGNLGVVRYNQRRYGEALDLLQASAAVALEQGDLLSYSIRLENLGNVYEAMAMPDSAKNCFTRAQKISEDTGDSLGILSTSNNLGQVFLDNGDATSAYRQFERARQIALNLGTAGDHMHALNGLASSLAAMGRHREAYGHMREFLSLRDSLFNQERDQRIRQMEAQYQNVVKEQKIQEQELELARRSSEKRLLIAIVLFILAGSIGTLLALISRHRGLRKIAAQEALLRETRIRELEDREKLLILNAMIDGQEEERKRIAKDLHDGLGGLLASVKLQLASIQREIGKLEQVNLYEQANHMVDTACEEVRRIAHNMMPDALANLGLIAALRDIAEQINRSGGPSVKVISINADERLDEKKEIMLYRIVQELLGNALKYAGANKILIQFSRDGDLLSLAFEDDGAGFDPEKARLKGGLGLRSVESRVRFLNGRIQISAIPGNGAAFEIEIPLNGSSSQPG
jgi:two-component system, NarL family, sensor kinase